VPPGPAGGGTLTQPLFSGDHVLESVAKGQATLRQGAKGPAARAIQKFLVAQGFKVGRGGADGDWGEGTTKGVKGWQAANGIGADGVIGKATLAAMDKAPPVSAPAAGAQPAPVAQPVATAAGPAGVAQPAAAPAAAATARPNTGPAAGVPGSRDGGLPQNFQKMWEAHPHNYQADPAQNTASSDVQVAQGWNPDQYSNTCAIRLSIMFNNLGGDHKITREKAKAAGLDPGRIPFSKKTGFYYILSAKEMWIYVSRYCGKPHAEFPARGRFADGPAFQEKFDAEVAPLVAGKKGIVAFDKIFTFAGTGHVDLFDGMKLSDADTWYPSQALKLWYV